MAKDIWVVYHQYVGTRAWFLSTTSGIHTSRKSARDTAKRYEDESVGQKYTAVKYTRAK